MVEALVILGVGSLLDARRTYSIVVRTFGFAAAPGVLILLAAVLSPYLPLAVALAPILVLRLAAAFLAIRSALGLGTLKTSVALVLAVAGSRCRHRHGSRFVVD